MPDARQTERDPTAAYQARVDAFESERERHRSRSRRISRARLLVFAGVIAAGVWAEERPGPLPLALTAAGLVGFVVLIARHQRERERERWFGDLVEVNRQGLHRLARAWERLAAHEGPPDAAEHPYAGDLDLFGPASVSQLLGPPGSAFGQSVLDGWLLAPAPPDTVGERQSAARELAGAHDLRDALAVYGRRTRSVRPGDIAGFLDWAGDEGWLATRPFLPWTARLLPLVTAATILADVLRPSLPPLWLLPLSAALALTLGPGRRAHRDFARAFSREGMFESYPELMETVASRSFEAPALRRLRAELEVDGVPASEQMGRLRRLMQLADLRHSAMMHLPVQLLTLWDFHVLRALEEWRAACGSHARAWLEALAELEALAGLAALAHDHPDWSFPVVDPAGPPRLEAESLGHPLLPAGERVPNDVRVGPPGTFLFVTGSNMSGKSTLLRALGTNVVLAQAGAPVCARSLRMPPLVVRTSVRVQDSLARGVSYFMAELQKLKSVVDEADRLRGNPEWRLLYLLDEILQGTNTAERQVAARRVIRHLVQQGAIGAVTSHDLELTAGPELADAAVPVHFTEEVLRRPGGRPAMTFDYRLREGVATSTNALRLMELVGLDGGAAGAPP